MLGHCGKHEAGRPGAKRAIPENQPRLAGGCHEVWRVRASADLLVSAFTPRSVPALALDPALGCLPWNSQPFCRLSKACRSCKLGCPDCLLVSHEGLCHGDAILLHLEGTVLAEKNHREEESGWVRRRIRQTRGSGGSGCRQFLKLRVLSRSYSPPPQPEFLQGGNLLNLRPRRRSQKQKSEHRTIHLESGHSWERISVLGG